MSLPAHRRHDISDAVWNLLEPHLPPREGAWGGKARDNRLFSNAFSGSYAAARRGAICHPIMGIGKTRIAGFAVGATKGFGKRF